MSPLKKCKYLFAAAAVIVFITAAGCASGVRIVSRERPVHFLPGSPQIIGTIDTEQNRELFEAVASGMLPQGVDMEGLFDRTRFVLFSMNDDGAGGTIFSAILQGSFPKVLTGGVIGNTQEFEKGDGRIPVYTDSEGGIQIAVPERDLIFVSMGKIDEMLENYKQKKMKPLEYEALKEMEVSDVVIYIADPAAGFLKGLPVDNDKFPLQTMWFSLFGKNKGYALSSVFALNDSKHAKALATLSKIVLIGWFRQHKLGDLEDLKKMEIKPVKDSVRITGLDLEVDAVLRLFFSMIPESTVASNNGE